MCALCSAAATQSRYLGLSREGQTQANSAGAYSNFNTLAGTEFLRAIT